MYGSAVIFPAGQDGLIILKSMSNKILTKLNYLFLRFRDFVKTLIFLHPVLNVKTAFILLLVILRRLRPTGSFLLLNIFQIMKRLPRSVKRSTTVIFR